MVGSRYVDCRQSRGPQASGKHRTLAGAGAAGATSGRTKDVIVFVTGAGGFLGRQLVQALADAGHQVVCAVRRPLSAATAPVRVRQVAADFARHQTPEDWLPHLAGVDAVVNAAGIFRQTRSARFADVHVRGPCALFAACAVAGVPRVVQLSALGADEQAVSAYHRSKKEADDYLLRLPLASVVVAQPSLVYGPGGASARFFTRLASLPLVPLPGSGAQPVQPLHVDDAIAALVRLIEDDRVTGRVPLVGPRSVTLRQWLAALRAGMGLGAPRFVPVPRPLVRAGAHLVARWPGSLLDPDTWQMLERGNTAPVDATAALLGRLPRPVERFIAPGEARAARREAQLALGLALLRVALALMWVWTGIVSFGLYPPAHSFELLARAGVPPPWQPTLLYGAAALDIAFGVATLLPRRPRRLWVAQALLIVFYTAVITARLPEFWLHPYGPVLKNLPVLAALAVLHALDEAPER